MQRDDIGGDSNLGATEAPVQFVGEIEISTLRKMMELGAGWRPRREVFRAYEAVLFYFWCFWRPANKEALQDVSSTHLAMNRANEVKGGVYRGLEEESGSHPPEARVARGLEPMCIFAIHTRDSEPSTLSSSPPSRSGL